MDNNIIKDTLSLIDEQNEVMSSLQKELLMDELNELPPLKKNNITVSTVYVYEDGEELEAKVYVRNGFNDTIILNVINVNLTDENGEVISSKDIDLTEMGEIPQGGARPWKIYFDKGDFKGSLEGAKVVFNTNVDVKRIAKVEEFAAFPGNITEEDKELLKSFLKALPDMECENVDLHTFNAYIRADGMVIITSVVRNSFDYDINLEKVPVTIKDSLGNDMMKMVFEMDNIRIEAFKARVVTLYRDIENKLQEDYKLTDDCVVYSLD